jgi:hypothetical protein
MSKPNSNSKSTPALAALFLLVMAVTLRTPALAADNHTADFIRLRPSGGWTADPAGDPTLRIWTSRPLRAKAPLVELVPSWNVDPGEVAWLRCEIRLGQGTQWSRWYNLGEWTAQTSSVPRRSITGQADAWARVATDTLEVRSPSERHQLRLAVRPTEAGNLKPRIKLLGVSTLSAIPPHATRPGESKAAIELPVPPLCQLDYPGGEVWCSPTSVAMILAYYATTLQRPELVRPVPEVAAAVHDPNWPGTGNWCFNMAYAGSFEGLNAYVTRLADLNEVRRKIDRGVPVALSICYNRLRGIQGRSSGHLVVCAGFTATGDVILMDPGTRKGTRQIYSPDRVLHAWDHSKRTTYIIEPRP